MDEVYIPLLYRLWLVRFHALRLIGPQIRVMHASHVIFQARQLERGVERWCLCSGEIMICGEAMQIYLILRLRTYFLPLFRRGFHVPGRKCQPCEEKETERKG